MAITIQPIGSPSATQQTTSFVNNGFTTDTNGGIQFPLQQGVPYKSLYHFRLIPQPNYQGCIAGSGGAFEQAAAGNIPLNTVAVAGATVGYNTSTPITYLGQFPCIQLDCEREVSFTWTAPTTAPVNIVITGVDYRGVSISEQLTVDVGNTNNFSSKMYSIIQSINFSANPGVTFRVGNSNTIGLPYLLLNLADVVSCTWNNATINAFNGDVLTGINWRLANAGVPVNVPSLTNAVSTRGRVSLPSSPDGLTILSLCYFVYGADSEVNGNLQNNWYTDITMAAVSNNFSGKAVFPYLTPYDLLGVQYPGNTLPPPQGDGFFQVYTNALAL
jgi:hypothetical protein